jgi:hypothetical protein
VAKAEGAYHPLTADLGARRAQLLRERGAREGEVEAGQR